MRVPLPQTVAEVESFACRRTLIFAIEIGLQEVVFKGDVVMVIQAIKSSSAKHSSYDHINDDIIHHSSQLSFFFFFFFARLIDLVIKLSMFWQRKLKLQ